MSKTIIPQCTFLDEDGKRCRCRSAIKHRVHLNNEMYDYPAWVEINLCVKHFLHFGGKFINKLKQGDI